jgi:hypothetical protein
MSEGRHRIEWVWRSREPARNAPHPDYPYGIALDLAHGKTPSCEVTLAYPAPGVGTWIISCAECGFSFAITAAGRPDDPTKVRVPCKPDRG